MHRETKRFKEADGYRVVNRVYSDPVSRISQRLHIAKVEFMRILNDTPEILRCELQEFDTLRIFYDGNQWIAESQANVQQDTERNPR